MADAPVRDPASTSGLRGWLSDVYWVALATGKVEALAQRLGDRATVDDPRFGRASGMPAVAARLEEMARWLRTYEAEFEKTAFTMGGDRDVTEGSLVLTHEGVRRKLPVAVVAERRREREVELRVYYSTGPVGEAHVTRAALLGATEVPLPPAVSSHLAALARGDVAALLATFETEGTLRDAVGQVHAREGGELQRFYERLFAAAGSGGEGLEFRPTGRADDGRTCALEYTLARAKGKDVPPRAGLAVYERGETGLLRAARVYTET